jgi:hypothetical protein
VSGCSLASEGAGTALAKAGPRYTAHAAERLAQRGITDEMVDAALRKGTRYWDPKNKSVNYVLEGGFAGGKDLLVGTNPVTGAVTTAIRGTDLVSSRFVLLE